MLTYFLDKRGKESKYRFLYHAVRSDILSKNCFPANACPPSARSRNTWA